MSAFHHAPAYIQRRTDEAIDAQCMATHSSTNDVDNCVDRSDLMEVDGLDRHIVNASFALAQQLEGTKSGIPCLFGNPRASNNLADHR